MNKATRNLDKWILWGWIAALIAAVILYAAGITHESFWYDEAYSAVIASYLPWQISAQVWVDNHPPLTISCQFNPTTEAALVME